MAETRTRDEVCRDQVEAWLDELLAIRPPHGRVTTLFISVADAEWLEHYEDVLAERAAEASPIRLCIANEPPLDVVWEACNGTVGGIRLHVTAPQRAPTDADRRRMRRGL